MPVTLPEESRKVVFPWVSAAEPVMRPEASRYVVWSVGRAVPPTIRPEASRKVASRSDICRAIQQAFVAASPSSGT